MGEAATVTVVAPVSPDLPGEYFAARAGWLAQQPPLDVAADFAAKAAGWAAWHAAGEALGVVEEPSMVGYQTWLAKRNTQHMGAGSEAGKGGQFAPADQGDDSGSGGGKDFRGRPKLPDPEIVEAGPPPKPKGKGGGGRKAKEAKSNARLERALAWERALQERYDQIQTQIKGLKDRRVPRGTEERLRRVLARVEEALGQVKRAIAQIRREVAAKAGAKGKKTATKFLAAHLIKVGPKGYIHGWIKVFFKDDTDLEAHFGPMWNQTTTGPHFMSAHPQRVTVGFGEHQGERRIFADLTPTQANKLADAVDSMGTDAADYEPDGDEDLSTLIDDTSTEVGEAGGFYAYYNAGGEVFLRIPPDRSDGTEDEAQIEDPDGFTEALREMADTADEPWHEHVDYAVADTDLVLSMPWDNQVNITAGTRQTGLVEVTAEWDALPDLADGLAALHAEGAKLPPLSGDDDVDVVDEWDGDETSITAVLYSDGDIALSQDFTFTDDEGKPGEVNYEVLIPRGDAAKLAAALRDLYREGGQHRGLVTKSRKAATRLLAADLVKLRYPGKPSWWRPRWLAGAGEGRGGEWRARAGGGSGGGGGGGAMHPPGVATAPPTKKATPVPSGLTQAQHRELAGMQRRYERLTEQAEADDRRSTSPLQTPRAVRLRGEADELQSQISARQMEINPDGQFWNHYDSEQRWIRGGKTPEDARRLADSAWPEGATARKTATPKPAKTAPRPIKDLDAQHERLAAAATPAKKATPAKAGRRLSDTEADALSTAQFSTDGSVVAPNTRTYDKLERDGFIDERARITDIGRAALAAHQPSAFNALTAARDLSGMRDDPAALRAALEGWNLTQIRAIFRAMSHPEPGSRATGETRRPFKLPLASQRAGAPELRASLLRAFAHAQSRPDGDAATRLRAMADEIEAGSSPAVPKPRRMPAEQRSLLATAHRDGFITPSPPDTGEGRLRNADLDTMTRKGLLDRQHGRYWITDAGRAAHQAGAPAPAKRAAPRAVEAADTVRAEGYFKHVNVSVRVVADGSGGYKGQRLHRANGEWQDDPSLGTGNTVRDITSRQPRGQWRSVAAPRKAAAPKPPKPPAAPPAPAGDTVGRLTAIGFRNPPGTRAEAADLLAPMKKPELLAIAREVHLPGATKLTAADLRLQIVEATTGRRLDSIATRGFTGPRPDQPNLPAGIPGKADGLDGLEDRQLASLAREWDVRGAPATGLPSQNLTPAERTRLTAALRRKSATSPYLPRETAAQPVTPATPSRPDENVPLRGNPEGDNMRMHGDSLTMGVAQTYAKAGRNGSANQMMDLRRRATTSGADGISPQQVVDELRAIRASETDPTFQRELDEAIAGIDAPMTPLPELPANTPPLARKLIEDLHAIPYARKGDGDRAGSGSVRGPSLVDQLAEVYRDVAAQSRGDDGRSPSDRIRSILRNQTHEINEGSFRIWALERALDTQDSGTGRRASPLEDELRRWERGQLPAGGPGKADAAAPAAPDPEQAARDRHVKLNRARGVAVMLAELDELQASQASPRALRHRLNSRAKVEDLPPAMATELADAADTSPRRLAAVVDRLAADHGLTRDSAPAGGVELYDRTRHEPIGGSIPDGTMVYIVRSGYVATVDGERVRVTRAAALEADEPAAPAAPHDLGFTSFEQVASSLSTEEQKRVEQLIRRDPHTYATTHDRTGMIGVELDAADRTFILRIAQQDRAFLERTIQSVRIKEGQERTAARLNMTPDALRQTVANRLRSLLAGKPIAVRVRDEDALRGILTDGRFRTQFDSGTRRAPGLGTDLAHRRLGEEILGIPSDTPKSERPVYGYVAVHGIEPALYGGRKVPAIREREGVVDPLSAYGQVQVVLKPKVRTRTTITVGDSLDEIGFVRPSPIDNPFADSVHIDGWYFKLESLDRIEAQDRRGRDYVETQIRGGVRTDDIAEVVFPSDPAPATVRALAEKGIPWRVVRATTKAAVPHLTKRKALRRLVRRLTGRGSSEHWKTQPRDPGGKDGGQWITGGGAEATAPAPLPATKPRPTLSPGQRLDRLFGDVYPRAKHGATLSPSRMASLVKARADLDAGKVTPEQVATAFHTYAARVAGSDRMTARIYRDLAQQLRHSHHTPPAAADDLVHFAEDHGWLARATRGVSRDTETLGQRYVTVEIGDPHSRDRYEVTWLAEKPGDAPYRLLNRPKAHDAPRQPTLDALKRYVADTPTRAARPRPPIAPHTPSQWPKPAPTQPWPTTHTPTRAALTALARDRNRDELIREIRRLPPKDLARLAKDTKLPLKWREKPTPAKLADHLLTVELNRRYATPGRVSERVEIPTPPHTRIGTEDEPDVADIVHPPTTAELDLAHDAEIDELLANLEHPGGGRAEKVHRLAVRLAKTCLIPHLTKVGPKGYIHGWIYVGPPAVGARVFDPDMGHGTVLRRGKKTTAVRFDSGKEHSWEHAEETPDWPLFHPRERASKPRKTAAPRAASKPRMRGGEEVRWDGRTDSEAEAQQRQRDEEKKAKALADQIARHEFLAAESDSAARNYDQRARMLASRPTARDARRHAYEEADRLRAKATDHRIQAEKLREPDPRKHEDTAAEFDLVAERSQRSYDMLVNSSRRKPSKEAVRAAAERVTRARELAASQRQIAEELRREATPGAYVPVEPAAPTPPPDWRAVGHISGLIQEDDRRLWLAMDATRRPGRGNPYIQIGYWEKLTPDDLVRLTPAEREQLKRAVHEFIERRTGPGEEEIRDRATALLGRWSGGATVPAPVTLREMMEQAREKVTAANWFIEPIKASRKVGQPARRGDLAIIEHTSSISWQSSYRGEHHQPATTVELGQIVRVDDKGNVRTYRRPGDTRDITISGHGTWKVTPVQSETVDVRAALESAMAREEPLASVADARTLIEPHRHKANVKVPKKVPAKKAVPRKANPYPLAPRVPKEVTYREPTGLQPGAPVAWVTESGAQYSGWVWSDAGSGDVWVTPAGTDPGMRFYARLSPRKSDGTFREVARIQAGTKVFSGPQLNKLARAAGRFATTQRLARDLLTKAA